MTVFQKIIPWFETNDLFDANYSLKSIWKKLEKNNSLNKKSSISSKVFWNVCDNEI